MAWFKKRKAEERAESTGDPQNVLLSTLLGKSDITRKQALNIPSLNGCIEFISNMITLIPIKLYQEKDNSVEEIKDDPRLRVLNDETGDTLDAVQFWKAMVADYFLGKGGYAYIRREKNQVTGLFYVDELQICVLKNTDPIFKDYDIQVQGKTYKPFDFMKILRKTTDGCQGISVISESPILASVAYNTLVFENALVTKGGNKKGFVKSAKKLTQDAIDALKTAWKKLYSNNEENVVVLNDGLEFQESSNTSVEMQLNENKVTNSAEICKLFNVPESIIKGTATEKDYVIGFKLAVLPVLRAIECALNKDLLLESEKGSKYFAFDTKEITKGDIKTRYDAYKVGLDANFLQIDEVRYMEDLPELGLTWIKLGLDTVLYDPKTKQIYTPNTDKTSKMINLKGGDGIEDGNQS